MKGIILLAILISSITLNAQNLGIGVRVGDPTGLTIKKYMDGSAWELNIGGANLLYDKGLYSNFFYNWMSSHSFKDQKLKYTTNSQSPPFGFQLHYLIQKEITPSMHWYYGGGGQFRIHKCRYSFQYQLPGSTAWRYSTGGIVTDLDIGGDGVIGVEYTPQNVPLSLFLDLTLFMEVVDEPFNFWAQGGIGLRFNFGGNSKTPKASSSSPRL